MRPAKGCYCCRAVDVPRHPGYPLLCRPCGDENQARRDAALDLAGVVALVTGSRVKIGYHTALRLLRQGATVVATTRFPLSAVEAFAREPDYPRWGDRLLVRWLDLMRVDLIGDFIGELGNEVPHLDILVNNAAQTVVDPAGLATQWEYETGLRTRALGASTGRAALPAAGAPHPDVVLPSVAAAAARVASSPDVTLAGPTSTSWGTDLAPPTNDWVKRSADVSLADLLAVQIVNVTAPYLLAVGLRGLLVASPHRNRFLVNVSSQEGKFAMRHKSSAHPHTNMAKAALNMMTKTLASEYKRDRIFTYSVDPGWVSHQFPAGWPTPPGPLPLRFEDAAARVTQPLADWRDVDRPPTGVFLKDYREGEW